MTFNLQNKTITIQRIYKDVILKYIYYLYILQLRSETTENVFIR